MNVGRNKYQQEIKTLKNEIEELKSKLCISQSENGILKKNKNKFKEV